MGGPRSGASARQSGKDRGPIRFKSFLNNTVMDVMKARGWRFTESETDWDFYWADTSWVREGFDQVRWDEGQRVNHFRNHYELTRKDLIIKNLKRQKKMLEREDRTTEASKYDFFPPTFTLPADYSLFVEEFKRNSGTWIAKPSCKAQGKGIFLLNKISQVSEFKRDNRFRTDGSGAAQGEYKDRIGETYVVQRYIENPYLIGGKKFDLRIYALVTSYAPLTIYLYRSGFARFSGHRFSMDAKDLDDAYIHLTNNAIQKNSKKYEKNAGGCKWNLRNLKLYMASKHGLDVVNQVFTEIQQIVIHSLLSVQRIIINDKHCFELYGYDVMIDDTLKPWLLEVNASPSLSASNQADYDLKFSLLDDMLSVIDMEHKLTGNEERIGGFDLVYRNGPITSSTARQFATFLGCYNELDKRSHEFPRKKKEETT
jgi:tubulin polyglutamylase TTLL9